MKFHDYPLAHIDLPIIIEPAHHEIDELVFVQSEKPSLPIENFQVAGWLMTNQSYEITEYEYPDGEEFTRFVANFGFDTPFVSGFMVGILPIIIMGGVVVFSFVLKPTMTEIRAEMNTGTLIGAVFFHISDVGQSLPPLEYLTLEDKMMTVLYALIIVAFLALAAQRKFNKSEDEQKAEQINRKFRYIIPVVIGVVFSAVWFF